MSAENERPVDISVPPEAVPAEGPPPLVHLSSGYPAARSTAAVRVAPSLTVLPPAVSRPANARTWSDGAGTTVPGLAAPARAASSARNAAVMASGTILARLSGFARLLAVGWVLGQGSLADAYNQANTIPNTVYDLLLGGVLSATLLPVLMQSLGRSDALEDDDAVPAIVTFLTVALLGATLVFWLAAPAIIRLFLLRASGPQAAAEKSLATTWLRLFTPQLLFIGLITITTSLLNARRRFGAVAFSPVLANLVTIGALAVAEHLIAHGSVSAYSRDSEAVAIVGIGTTAGYLVQLVAQLPALLRAHIVLRLRWWPRHPALRTIGRLSGWTVGAVVANQLSFTLVSVLANTTSGAYSAFSYAYAFMLLPYAIVAASIAYAAAPDLAQLWLAGEIEAFAKRGSYATRMTLLLLVPGGVGYALIARPVVVLAMAHGNLSLASAELTGSLLAVFALGLPGYSAYLIVMRAFQSKQDTRSMFWLYVIENVLTVAGAMGLYPSMGVRGLAIAWIGAYTVTLPFAWARLRRSAPVSIPAEWWGKMALSTAIMGVVTAGLLQLLPSPHAVMLSAARLLTVVVVGGAIFVVTGRALGLNELADLKARYRSFGR